MKRHFDVVIIVPLEEEFNSSLKHFDFKNDLSTDTQIMIETRTNKSDCSVLIIKQNKMGRTSTEEAALNCLDIFDVSLFVCVGIAGAISGDLNIGDICYTGQIVDAIDNAKIGETRSNKIEVSLSTTYYETPLNLITPLNLGRLIPPFKKYYEEWQSTRHEEGKKLVPGEFSGKKKKRETLQIPVARDGLIVCGSVSGSAEYNRKIRGLDRKILAIETESGGLFAIAKLKGIPALAVRGISDYAEADKNLFEEETNNQARTIAAENAFSFLALQLTNAKIVEYLRQERLRHQSTLPLHIPSAPTQVDKIEICIIEQAKIFDERLRTLAPAYSLQAKGYRLPIPRLRIKDPRASGIADDLSAPMEVLEALRESRVVVVHLPKVYPDRSLSWIIGTSLLTEQMNDQQIVPCIIEASGIQVPRNGLSHSTPIHVADVTNHPAVKLVYIIDDFRFESRTRSEFLLREMDANPAASFIVVTRSQSNIIIESEFTNKSAAAIARVCDVSFAEISFFLRKNFEMGGPESEVIATRLRETFHNFKLSAHPTYFAGIPSATLSALLDANRRAELIELAVAGYLSYVVSQDKEPVALSRKTRERFLSSLVYEQRIQKRNFTEADAVAFAAEIAEKYDYNISPARFITSFIEKGILQIDDKHIKFTLPFIESYLLAQNLKDNSSDAIRYFEIGDTLFDLPAFSLYAELGISSEYEDHLIECLDKSIKALKRNEGQSEILLGDTIQPAMFLQQERVESLRKRLNTAVEEVRNDADKSQEKQQLLDSADRLREKIADKSDQSKANDNGDHEKKRTTENDALSAFRVAVTLLGAGAERIEGATKRVLVSRIVELSNLIIDDWTRQLSKVDYKAAKSEMMADRQFIGALSKSDKDADMRDAERVASSLFDIIEYVSLSEPFRSITATLCEEARDKVLAESIIHTKFDRQMHKLIRAIWLSDVDTPRGKTDLIASIKNLPKSRFLRISLASHLIMRVYWTQWKKADRLSLLDAAEESIKILGRRYGKSEIKRMIEREREDGNIDDDRNFGFAE